MRPLSVCSLHLIAACGLALLLGASGARGQELTFASVEPVEETRLADGRIQLVFRGAVENGRRTASHYSVQVDFHGQVVPQRSEEQLASGARAAFEIPITIDLREWEAPGDVWRIDGAMHVLNHRREPVDREYVYLTFRRPPPLSVRTPEGIPPPEAVARPRPEIAPVSPSLQIVTATGPATVAALSPSALLDRTPVWRTQLRVHTCNLEGAGTDGEVWVRLGAPEDRGEPPAAPMYVHRTGRVAAAGRERRLDPTRFWLDRGGDDRKRDALETYEVAMPDVVTVHDITRIEFGIDSTDDWCIDRVALVVNSTGSWSESLHVFDLAMETTWLRDSRASASSVIVATDADLRASPTWNLSGAREALSTAPTTIPGDVLASMLEATIGNAIATDQPLAQYKWGRKRGPAYLSLHQTEDAPATQIQAKADLNTSGRVGRINDVDLYFTLDAACVDGEFQMSVSDISGGPSNVLRAFSDPLGIRALTMVINTLNQGARPVTPSGSHDRPNLACTDALRFGPDGTLYLTD